ncbi:MULTISPECIES: phage holin family protein [Pectobacterium]|uniref:Holin n=2 Tax=Pectobacterium TaxID=122277 RepID=A0AA93AJ61_9GAMM|nr:MULTISPECIES: phage holin family protein [Pectobacterium]GKX44567.1 holin [Pectobacterium carotovorum subsp. carotovorum]KGA37159.1 holin [Pectobacterium odoriferum]KHN51337.1 holin [Pectobacterium fontis]RRO01865.1 holin [Pectobacterium aquaticum]RRO03840.1 holin [Pectobacterium aquaticum]
MNEPDKSILSLFLIGALIVVGKVLAGGEPVTLRLFIGRVLLGGFVSMVAGVALVQFPNLSPVAINGIGAALGIAGYQAIELLIKSQLDKRKKTDGEQ